MDEILVLEKGALDALKGRRFDLAINLDKERPALDTIMKADAGKKIGFGRSASGELCALDEKSDYAYRLGIDDDLKFRQNKKSYQTISFEQLGLVFKGEEYVFSVDEESRRWAAEHLRSLGVAVQNRAPMIGLNTGSGNRFAGKKLPETTLARLGTRLRDWLGASVLLVGGPDEIERNSRIQGMAPGVVNTGSHALKRFAAIVENCDAVLTGDTTALHVAIAVKTPVVAYFASTCAPEIELYGRGVKIVSPIACAPCYKKICPIDEQCMKDMTVETLLEAIKETLCAEKTPR